MEANGHPEMLKVRYCLRSTLAPLLLAGSLMMELSDFPLIGSGLMVLGLALSIVIFFRPFMEIINGQAFSVGLLSGARRSAGPPEEALAGRGLRWFLRKGDLEKVRALHPSLRRPVSLRATGLAAGQ